MWGWLLAPVTVPAWTLLLGDLLVLLALGVALVLALVVLALLRGRRAYVVSVPAAPTAILRPAATAPARSPA
jgi:hypothetical protein